MTGFDGTFDGVTRVTSNNKIVEIVTQLDKAVVLLRKRLVIKLIIFIYRFRRLPSLVIDFSSSKVGRSTKV